ncbi:MAG: S9 family peptidase [Thermoanaerobaculia bacterium]
MKSNASYLWTVKATVLAVAVLSTGCGISRWGCPGCGAKTPTASREASEQMEAVATTTPAVAEAPIAKIETEQTEIHGEVREDPYAWLERRGDPEVIAYLEAENAYTESVMTDTEDLQESLYREMRGRIQEEDVSVPAREDDYWYYTRTEEGKQYPIYCRKKGSLEAAEELLLDVNALAEGHEYFRLGALGTSPDHRLLAYSTDITGAEVYELVVKDLRTGELLPDHIQNTYYGVAWAADNRTLFYTTLDEAKRPYRVWRHVLGAVAAEDDIVYEETDERFYVDLGVTRSEAFVVIDLGSSITSEVRVLPADEPQGDFRVVLPRRQGTEYSIDHHGEHFYVLTNAEAKNFRLARLPVAGGGWEDLEEVLAHRPEVMLEAVDLFRDFMVVWEREEGLPHLRVRGYDGAGDRRLIFPEEDYTLFGDDNPEFVTDTYRFGYSSLVTPASVYDYHLDAGNMELMKRRPVPTYERELYRAERVWATAEDGTRVAVSLVYRQGFERDGSRPALLIGYGSYGSSYDPSFNSDLVSLLDRGFLVAIAHIRGGSEMGEPWHDAGKMLAKRNTFTDFIACAEHLVAGRYTAPERLSIMGRSAGGLLIGAVLNMRADLFGAAIAGVPFVDVINTMLDDSIPLTVTEYEEWGNPNDKTYYDYMLSYSPYDNVKAQEYPRLLVTAGLNDPRVQYWEPAKWVARLRATRTGDELLLLKTHMGAGHAGASGRFERLHERAFEYAFLLKALNVTDTNGDG